MSRELYACVHATEFAAQAMLRLRTDLKNEPVAIVVALCTMPASVP